MIIQIQVFRNYPLQFIPSIVLTVDENKFVFNLPETFQRFRSDQCISQLKSAKYFFQQFTPNYFSGFYCYCINLFAGNHCFNSYIYGPPKFSMLIDNLRKNNVVNSYLFPFSSYEFFKQNKTLAINNLQAWNKLNDWFKTQSGISTQLDIDSYIAQNFPKEQINDASQFINQNTQHYQDDLIEIIPILVFEKLEDMSLNQSQNVNTSLNYIIVINKTKGKINKSKLDSLNLPIKMRQQLFKDGQIILENQQKIFEQDIREPDIPKQVIMIIDHQTINSIDSLLNSTEYTQFFSCNIDQEKIQVKLIIHLSPIEVLLNQQYQQYFLKFQEDCEHIFCDYRLKDNSYFQKKLSEQKTDIDQYTINIQKKNYKHHEFIEKLYQYFPSFFPKFQLNSSDFFNNLQKQEIAQIITHQQIISKSYIILRYHQYTLQPIHKKGYQIIDSKLLEKKKNSLQDSEQFQQLIQEISNDQQLNLQSKNQSTQDFEPEITFLGTGSMQPTQYRNVSAILIKLKYLQDVDPKQTFILLDCGEGTLAQINEKYQSEQQNIQFFLSLSLIFISHYHADHNIGLLQILQTRQQILKYSNSQDQLPQLYIIIPSIFYVFYKINIDLMKEFSNVKIVLCQQIQETSTQFGIQDMTKDFTFQYYKVDNLDLLLQKLNENYQNMLLMLTQLRLKISTIPVIHVPQSFGIVLETIDKIKISYSGDTRPCKEFINASYQADLMIHESTFTNNLQTNAEKHFHCTAREAIESAIQSEAKFLILTHFSQRFARNVINLEDLSNDVNNKNQNLNNLDKKEEEIQIKKENDNNQEQLKQQQIENKKYFDFLEKKVVLAFDQLSFQLKNIGILSKVTKCAQLLYPIDELQQTDNNQ